MTKKIDTQNFGRSSFWLSDTLFGTESEISRGVDFTKLAATQRAIANFVTIVTSKQIPVVFKSSEDSFTDGKQIVIGTDTSPNQFDSTVGLALHEGSHITHTDFKILHNFDRHVSLQGCDPDLNITDSQLMCIKNLLNWIEDRRIDMLSYQSAPGYRNYYEAMYNKYFNSKIIDKALREGAKTEETWDDYLFHIINFTNPNRDLSALELLQDIWNMIDIKNILRLKSTNDCFVLACDIYKKLNAHLKQEETDTDSDDEEGSLGDSDENAETDANASGESSPGQSNPLSKRQLQQLEKAVEKQREFLNGDTKKAGRKLSKTDTATLKTIKDAGTEVVNIPKSYHDDPETGNTIETIVIRKMTKNLIENFEFSDLFEVHSTYHLDRMQKAVNSGILLGKQLGRKLKLRNENRTLKSSRLETGKIDRRLISELGYGNVNVFHRIVSDSYKNFMIHISIDASGSMSGAKMCNAVKSAVAIAQAASMTTGIRVQISFRGTAGRKDKIHTLYAYDSAHDKMIKIKTLFKHIDTFGCTPEGAAFRSIEKYIIEDAKGDECIFINYSDGEPSSYVHDPVQYTTNVINKFRQNGLQIIGYFITGGYVYESSKHNFKKMYGADSEFVDSTRLIEIAKTLNNKFLEQKSIA
jgi:hypothetical protein